MPKRLVLTEIQRDVMSVLEEAGAEEFPTVFITLWADSSRPSQKHFHSELVDALHGLESLGLVEVTEYTAPLGWRSREYLPGDYARDFVRWDSERTIWSLADGANKNLHLALTHKGITAVART